MKHCLDLLDLHHDYPVFPKCEVDNVHMVYRTGHSNLYLRHSRIRHLQHDNKKIFHYVLRLVLIDNKLIAAAFVSSVGLVRRPHPTKELFT